MSRQKLETLKDQFMLKIQEAAENKDIEAIEHFSSLARQVEKDLAIISEVEGRSCDYELFLSTGSSTRQCTGNQGAVSSQVHFPEVQIRQSWTNPNGFRRNKAPINLGESKMAKGRFEAQSARKTLETLCRERGVLLQFESRTTYRTPKGRIAVPFANEQTPNKWFLGIKEGIRRSICPFFAVVCICRTIDNENLLFVLPLNIMQPVWSNLSRSHGDVKLNIIKEDDDHFLVVPPRNRISIRGRVNDLDALL